MNNSGKVLTIFLIIGAVLLITLTALSSFFWQREVELREDTETKLEATVASEKNLQEELKTVKKENFLLEEKNKEADERINDLTSELELETGLREESKLEIADLKKSIEDQDGVVKKLEEKMADEKKLSEGKIAELSALLKREVELKQEWEQKYVAAVAAQKKLEENLTQVEENIGLDTEEAKPVIAQKEETAELPKEEVNDDQEGVDLEKIVVVPAEIPEGRILSVDQDTDFVIVNLGEKDGVTVGIVMSVYRGKEYLGDIKVTRVQPEMSACDLIPPFSSKLVRKNDQVIARQ